MESHLLISSTIESIHPEENGIKALEMMKHFRINHLAIVKNEFFLGVISDKEILSWDSKEEYIDEHLDNLNSPFVKFDQHLFDIIEVIEKNNLSIVPVLDKDNKYLGVITSRKMMYTIAKTSTIQSEGGVIILEMNKYDYSLAKISSIIESNNTQILSSHIIPKNQSKDIKLTLKLNTEDISNILNDFERHGYKVSASFRKQKEDTDFLDRYESLMRFLNP